MTLIGPIVTNGCENWTLPVRDVNRLLLFERQILKQIVQTEEGWRKRNDEKLEKLMRGEDIIKYIKAQKIKWWRHLNRMEITKRVTKTTEWKLTGMKTKGSQK